MKAFLFLFTAISIEALAGHRGLTIPSLDCDGNLFYDVSVDFDDRRVDKRSLTTGLICEKLTQKFIKRTVPTQVTRFILDEMSPQEVVRYLPRANDFFKLISFKPSVLGRNTFDMSPDDLEMITKKLLDLKPVKIRKFATNQETEIVAFYENGTTYFNPHKLQRPACETIGTIVHEYMHSIGYGHGDNNPLGKENTVPYYFGDRAQKLCEAGVI